MKETDIKGNAWKFGDNINTDLIFPNKYKHYVVDDMPKSGQYAMVGIDCLIFYLKFLNAGD